MYIYPIPTMIFRLSVSRFDDRLHCEINERSYDVHFRYSDDFVQRRSLLSPIRLPKVHGEIPLFA